MTSRANKPATPAARHDDAFPWLAATMLAIESFEVICLRTMKLAGGDHAACREASLMVNEKIDASFEAMASMQSGASAASIVDRYRQHVAANARRLQPA
ncbi:MULTISPECIES: hypothetical protein [Rhodopseudomonas]|uniref:Uncharacterized protein n=1 Tax=Rhodopseudomonas palustris TaxID=1076 RepID=A0A0D7EUB3_RHOPL|nr:MULTISPECIES: hypothetical protein [Rhodopseudomonas]KIZ44165.1 hypothetical protein OO17_10170 [Rhodopseudomonas palustris]MDF3810118.1 hypothetical protein [Rhodopseudomonas sp. BAL398]WOK19298.1 hypothetical protein RBJ75_07210 [Rhodopseudomonas sp. BAL398]